MVYTTHLRRPLRLGTSSASPQSAVIRLDIPCEYALRHSTSSDLTDLGFYSRILFFKVTLFFC